MTTSPPSSQPQLLPIGDWAELEQPVPLVPWQPGFQLGLGINALTGDTTSIPFSKVPNDIPDPSTEITYIRTVRDTLTNSELREFGGGANFDFTYSPADSFTAGVKAMIRNSIAVSSSSLAFVLFSSTETPFVTRDEDFELTPEAQALANSNPWQFRERYGDYFIADAKYAVKYAAVFVLSETSEDTQKVFQAKIHAGIERLDLSLAREIDKHMGKSSATVTISARTFGTVKADAKSPFKDIEKPASLEEAYETAKWFANPKNMRGQPVYAHLRPFERVRGCNLPPKVPVTRVVLNELSDLRRNLRKIVELADITPDFCTRAVDIRELFEMGDELMHNVSKNRTSFAHDSVVRRRFLRIAAAHLKELERFREVLKFFEVVRDAARREPGAGDVGWKMRAGGLHQYGVIAKRGVIDVTPSETVRYVAEIGRSSINPIMASNMAVPFDEQIVGWTMLTEHKDGSWKQHSHHVIFSRFPQFKFYPVAFRECTYTFQAYVVKKNKYFSALCEALPGILESTRMLPTADNPPPRRVHGAV